MSPINSGGPDQSGVGAVTCGCQLSALVGFARPREGSRRLGGREHCFVRADVAGPRSMQVNLAAEAIQSSAYLDWAAGR